MTEPPEVTTDGRTVWVNAPILVGRFCPISGEVVGPDDVRAHKDAKPTLADWVWFVNQIKARLGVEIDDVYRPAYIPMPSLLLPISQACGEDIWCACLICGLPQEGRGVVYEHHVGLPVEFLVKIRGRSGSTVWHGLHEKCADRNQMV